MLMLNDSPNCRSVREVRECENFRILELQNFRTCIQRDSNVSEWVSKMQVNGEW